MYKFARYMQYKYGYLMQSATAFGYCLRMDFIDNPACIYTHFSDQEYLTLQFYEDIYILYRSRP